ncbi:MAG TPA: cytochrome C oxidase subunit IV family protein [Thermoanaerobaculia bacterium]|jgi:cytochrome c oxidase subunit 4
MNEHEHHKHAPAHHVTALPIYFGIFIALMVLTVLTVYASRVDLGWLNTPIAMAIAIIKCALVILWFMHVIHSPKLTWVVVIASFLWLAVLFALTFADYLTRGWSVY